MIIDPCGELVDLTEDQAKILQNELPEGIRKSLPLKFIQNNIDRWLETADADIDRVLDTDTPLTDEKLALLECLRDRRDTVIGMGGTLLVYEIEQSLVKHPSV